MPQLPAIVMAAALAMFGSTHIASAESVRELNPTTGIYNCPVYSPCGPGMVGYNAGKDENGCYTMACRPEDEAVDNDLPRQDLPEEENPDNGSEIEYRYEKPDSLPPVAPRLIDPQ